MHISQRLFRAGAQARRPERESSGLAPDIELNPDGGQQRFYFSSESGFEVVSLEQLHVYDGGERQMWIPLVRVGYIQLKGQDFQAARVEVLTVHRDGTRPTFRMFQRNGSLSRTPNGHPDIPPDIPPEQAQEINQWLREIGVPDPADLPDVIQLAPTVEGFEQRVQTGDFKFDLEDQLIK